MKGERITHVKYGWGAPPLHEQFGVPEEVFKTEQRLSEALTLLSIHGVVTQTEKRKAVKRLTKKIEAKLKDRVGSEEYVGDEPVGLISGRREFVMGERRRSVEYGWGAEPLHEQFGVDEEVFKTEQRLSEAMTLLSIHGIVTRGEREKMVKRLTKKIEAKLDQ